MGLEEKKVSFSLEAKLEGYLQNLATAQKATQQSTAAIEGSFNALGGGIHKITGIIGTLAGIVAGGAAFKGIISETTTWIGEVGKLSRTLGISAEQASALKVATHTLGIEADVVSGAALRLAKSINADGGAAIQHLGVSVRDSNGHLRNSVDIMTDVNSALSKLKAGTDRNAAGMSIYSRSWGEVQATLRLTTEEMERAKKTAEELHLVFSSQDTQQVREYKMELNEIKLVGESISINVGRALLPELRNLGLFFNKYGPEGANIFAESLREIIRVASETAVVVGATWDKLKARTRHAFDGVGMFSKKGLADTQQQIDAINQGAAGQFAEINNLLYGKHKIKGPAGADAPGTDKGSREATTKAVSVYERYISTLEGLNKQIRSLNPELTEFQKKNMEVDDTVARLSREQPQFIATWQKYGRSMKQNMKYTEDLKNEMASLKAERGDLEDTVKTNEGRSLNKFLGFETLQLKKTKFADLSGAVTRTQPKYDLLGSITKDDYLSGEASFNAKGQMTARQQEAFDAMARNRAKAAEHDEALRQEQEFDANLAALRGDSMALEMIRIQEEEDRQIQSWANQTDSFEEYERRMAKIKEQSTVKLAALQRQSTIQTLQEYGQYTSQVGQLFDNLYAATGRKNKSLFYIGKGISMANTTINTAEAVMKAYAQTGIFGGPVAAAIVAAVGASQLALIASQTPEGGGSPSGSYGGGTTTSPIVTQPVENTTNTNKQTITINIQGNVIGQEKWVEDQLAPTIRNLVGRNVDFGLTPA